MLGNLLEADLNDQRRLPCNHFAHILDFASGMDSGKVSGKRLEMSLDDCWRILRNRRVHLGVGEIGSGMDPDGVPGKVLEVYSKDCGRVPRNPSVWEDPHNDPAEFGAAGGQGGLVDNCDVQLEAALELQNSSALHCEVLIEAVEQVPEIDVAHLRDGLGKNSNDRREVHAVKVDYPF